MDRRNIIQSLTDNAERENPFWGICVSRPNDAAKAMETGASWVLASHAGGLDPAVPASAIGLLPYADANSEVLAMGGLFENSPVPVFAGVFASDQFAVIENLLKNMRKANYNAIQNFPSVGLAEGRFKSFLDDAGMGYDQEVNLIRLAREMDFFASAVVFDADQAKAMTDAGADMLVFHPGLTADGEYRQWSAQTKSRFADVISTAPAEKSRMIVARMAFEFEETVELHTGGIQIGVQFDKNIG